MEKSQRVPLLRRPRPPSEKYLKSTPQYSIKHEPTLSSLSRPHPLSHPITADSQPHPPGNTPNHVTPSSRGQFHIYSLQPKGPPALPPGKVLTSPFIIQPPENMTTPTKFVFNDLLQSCDQSCDRLIKSKLNSAMISRENYLKMTSWFATHTPQQITLNTVNLEGELLPSPMTRKPQYQLLIEFHAILKDIIDISELSKTSSTDSLELHDNDDNNDDLFIQGARSRYFCGEERNNSPFDYTCRPLINPAEVAILHSIMYGGTKLTLKAHFLSELPDLSSLITTLTHLNLSFNNFKVFPLEVCQLLQLKVLKLRNNPIKEIPSAIKSLQKLQVLSIPFNLLADLPPGLFDVTSLQELDISHNSLQWISPDIAKLKHLIRLNIECNQLTGLPSTMLTLNLTLLQVDSNYFHPLLWKANTHNQPQTLADLCCLHLTQERVPPSIKDIINKPSGICDYCKGPIHGCGLRLIHAVQEETFQIKNLPFIFQLCSPPCHKMMRTSILQ